MKKFPMTAIAQRYKDRWRIEWFFKWIKQHLKIRRFLGRSENAVRLRILCALISYLLLALYKKAHGFEGRLRRLLATVHARLFQRPAMEIDRERKRREQRLAFSELPPICSYEFITDSRGRTPETGSENGPSAYWIPSSDTTTGIWNSR